MKSPCIAYPENEPLVLIRASQVRLCDGNHCAAALLSYFGYWHSIRVDHLEQAEHTNKVAAMHGDIGDQDTTLMQYHTEEAIEAGLLHLYGRKTIRAAVALLVTKGFLSLHGNPNQRFRFDRTHYFLFHPENVQAELGVFAHEVKMPHREGSSAASSGKNTSWSGKNTSWSGKNTSSISEITSEITPKEVHPPISPHGGTGRDAPRQPGQRATSRTKASHQPNTNYTPGFELAWRAYPSLRKQGKVETFAIWRERDLEPRAAEIAEKLTRLALTVWEGIEKQKIPMPTTWFNQARYEDELVPLDTVPNPRAPTRYGDPRFSEKALYNMQSTEYLLRKHGVMDDDESRAPGVSHQLRPGR